MAAALMLGGILGCSADPGAARRRAATSAAEAAQTIFGERVPPAYAADDTQPVALGVRFRSAVAGTITAIRMYRQVPISPGTIVRLFTSDMTQGELSDGALDEAEQSTPGWQEVPLQRAVPIAANRTYIAWYTDRSGQYSYEYDGLAGAVTNGALTALADSEVDENGVSGNGVFAYGDGEVGPPQSFRATNYFVDVVFVPAAAPTVVEVAPRDGATDVSPNGSVMATFSTEIDPATINAQTFTLADPDGNLVAATYRVTSSGRSAQLVPSQRLAFGTTYGATLVGGPNGVKDSAGNPLAQDFHWSFTTVPAQGDAPHVISTSPAAGAADVSPTTTLFAFFDAELDPSTVTPDTVQLVDDQGGAVPLAVQYGFETQSIIARPQGMGLALGTTYTAILHGGAGGIASARGVPMAADERWSFTTRATP